MQRSVEFLENDTSEEEFNAFLSQLQALVPPPSNADETSSKKRKVSEASEVEEETPTPGLSLSKENGKK